MTLQRIDVHHHVLPPEYLAAMDRLGLKEAGGVAFPDWSPAASIEMMGPPRYSNGHCFGFVAGSLFR
jgi:hypothetical protein